MSEIENTLLGWVTEAANLRASLDSGLSEETLADLHERLLRARAAQDRIEGILGQLLRLRGRIRLAVRSARDAYDDRLDEVIRSTKVTEYSSVREREAQFALGAFEERRGVRSVEKMLVEVDTAHDYVSLLHRGIDGARRDVDLRVRILTTESRLER